LHNGNCFLAFLIDTFPVGGVGLDENSDYKATSVAIASLTEFGNI
jgi:hypothetical protein